jgi:hypothetical protein
VEATTLQVIPDWINVCFIPQTVVFVSLGRMCGGFGDSLLGTPMN